MLFRGILPIIVNLGYVKDFRSKLLRTDITCVIIVKIRSGVHSGNEKEARVSIFAITLGHRNRKYKVHV